MSVSVSNFTQYRIAVLDDSAPTRRMTAMILQRQLQCQVDTYSRADQVLMLMDGNSLPDLFLFDIIIDVDNEIDGIELCRRLKNSAATCHIPVIFFSAHANAQTRVQALKAGGADYIDKPFYPEELVARVKSHLDLHISRQEIQRQIEQQQALLRVLCHDLQNPVASTFTLLDFMRTQKEYHAETLGLAVRSTESALGLIAHVREYQALMHGYKEYTIQTIDVAEAIAESIEIIEPLANKKKIYFRTELDSGVQLKINRVVFIHNILNNLLTNALKFSDTDSFIDLSLKKVATEASAFCVIEITDYGIGIPKEIQKTLFEPSQNRSRPGTAAEQGTGFGMPLVKAYVDLFGGTIAIQSPLNQEELGSSNKQGTKVRLSFLLNEND